MPSKVPASKVSKPPATQPPVPKSVSTFTVLPLHLPPLPGLPPSFADAPPTHYLYIQPHAPSHPIASTERSLFVANVPVDANEENIRALFAEQVGGARVDAVEFDGSVPAEARARRRTGTDDDSDEAGMFVTVDASGGGTTKSKASADERGKKRKREEEMVRAGVIEDEESALPKIWAGELRRSGSAAVVVFVDAKSCRGAMREVKRIVGEGRTVEWKGGGVKLGVDRYKAHLALRYPPSTLLESTTNAYLATHDALAALQSRLAAHARSVPDEDGFTLVTRGGGRAAPSARLDIAEQKKAELEARREKNKVGTDFYRFQNRERRKEEEGRLRREFEKDRKRVAEMRERRGRVMPER